MTQQQSKSTTLMIKGLFLFFLIVSFSLDSSAQCKGYTKKHCLPSLSPYVHNGQLTSAVLNPGDSADVALTFNAGKEYRLLVCNQEQIGKHLHDKMKRTTKDEAFYSTY